MPLQKKVTYKYGKFSMVKAIFVASQIAKTPAEKVIVADLLTAAEANDPVAMENNWEKLEKLPPTGLLEDFIKNSLIEPPQEVTLEDVFARARELDDPQETQEATPASTAPVVTTPAATTAEATTPATTTPAATTSVQPAESELVEEPEPLAAFAMGVNPFRWPEFFRRQGGTRQGGNGS
jgi:hypothetical protein